MACLGGTPEKPRTWWRYVTASWDPNDMATGIHGRTCDREKEVTNRRFCSSCPAYRGRHWNGKDLLTGMTLDGGILALSDDERERFLDLWEESEDPFTDQRVQAFRDYLVNGRTGAYGDETLRRIGDPDALARDAAKVRERRARSGRYRDYMRDYMRAYRRRQAVSLARQEEKKDI
jgi:hypothetical protein